MTREEILALPPGPELDALVAERVMGWFCCSILERYANGAQMHPESTSVGFSPEDGNRELKTIGGYSFYTCNRARPVPCYSTDTAAAWQVAEHLRRDGWTVRMSLHPDDTLGRPCHYVEFVRLLGKHVQRTLLVGSECMPLSICRAALLTTLS